MWICRDRIRKNIPRKIERKHGSCTTGLFGQSKYITPFGSSVIKMYRGATDQQAVQMKQERTDLLVFLRGTKSAKKELKEKKPDQYHHFEEILSLRERHIVKNLPSEYVFALRACYKAE